MLRMTISEANKKFGSIFKEEKKKGNKYNAKKVLLDGKKFDSASEGDYYAELKFQEKAGLIKGIETQVKESFYAYGKFICNYYVDFKIYHNDGTEEFIEHKGMATPLWRLKWKLLLAKYEQEIRDKKVICSINWYRKQKFHKSKK
jgi:hypothetical protein